MIKKVVRFKCKRNHLHGSKRAAVVCQNRRRQGNRIVKHANRAVEGLCIKLAAAVVIGRICGLKPSDLALMLVADLTNNVAPASQKENDRPRGQSEDVG